MPPAMWFKATLTIAMSSVVMNVAIEMTATIDHGLRPPATERTGVQCPPSPPPRSPAISAHPDGRLHRHAGTERAVPRRVVEHDLHRHALHDLDEVAAGVFRREDSERLAGAALDRIDVALDLLGGGGIHLYHDGL